MGLAALDFITMSGLRRIRTFAEGPARNHLYPLYIGVGMALAKMHLSPEPRLARLEPVIGWAIADGIGFHETFFRRTALPPHVRVPSSLSQPMQRVFHHGVGRALWFSLGANPTLVELAVSAFPRERHADLWAGVGLAATYVGGATASQLNDLRDLAGRYALQLAISAVIAAWGRQLGDGLGSETELASVSFSGRSAPEAARIGADTKMAIPVVSMEPQLLTWRDLIERRLTLPSSPTT